MGPWELDSRPFFGRNSENTQNLEMCQIWVRSSSKFGPGIRKLKNLPKKWTFPELFRNWRKIHKFRKLVWNWFKWSVYPSTPLLHRSTAEGSENNENKGRFFLCEPKSTFHSPQHKYHAILDLIIKIVKEVKLFF